MVCDMDTSAGQKNRRNEASNLIFNWNATSHADGTEIMGGEGSVSNAAADDCQTLVHHSENSKAEDETEAEAWSLYSWQCGQVEPLCASSNDINKKRTELRHGAEHDSSEEHGSGYLVWTLGVGMADGPRALTWEVPCARVAGVRQWCGETIVQTCTIEGSVGDVVKASLVQETNPGHVGAK